MCNISKILTGEKVNMGLGIPDDLTSSDPRLPQVSTTISLKKVKIVTRKHIPRGCRQNYIAGIPKNLENLYDSYKEKFAQNPFDDETIEIGECLIAEISEQRRKNWRDTIEDLNLAQNSSTA